MKNLIIIVFFISAILSLNAQEALTTFGITYKPMLSGGFINESENVESEGGVKYLVPKQFGYNLGMVVRKGFNKTFSLETGITYTQRNFSLQVNDESSDFDFKQNFGVVGYELPILGLVYIQLDQRIFMDASFGGGLDIFPSDVALFSSENQVVMEGRRNSWVLAFLSANIGWEYRTPKSGIFYIGGTFHRPFGPIYSYLMEYDYDAQDPLVQPVRLLQIINGNYLTLDFRYFFHEDPEKRLKRKKKN
jgi:hypothetical protein|tara:strand:- start:1617 stop:2360 length:744 start_codon:yes stop_codon:yes gene_type:complete